MAKEQNVPSSITVVYLEKKTQKISGSIHFIGTTIKTTEFPDSLNKKSVYNFEVF